MVVHFIVVVLPIRRVLELLPSQEGKCDQQVSQDADQADHGQVERLPGLVRVGREQRRWRWWLRRRRCRGCRNGGGSVVGQWEVDLDAAAAVQLDQLRGR